MAPLVSVIIVNFNTRDLLENCLSSLFQHTRKVSFEIIVVDNASQDGSSEMVLNEFSDVKLIQNKENTGFGQGNNLGASYASGKYLMLLNSDAVLVADTATALVRWMEEHPKVGAVGPEVKLPTGQRQPRICGSLPSSGKIGNDSFGLSTVYPKRFPGIHLDTPLSLYTEVGWISGVCMLIRKKAFDQIYGFDPKFFLYTEDIDLCYRIHQAGWKIVHFNAHGIIHHCGASSTTEADRIRNTVLQQRHLLILLGRYNAAHQVSLAKWFLGLGLLIRICLGLLYCVSGGQDRAFLLRSAKARLSDLFHLDSKNMGGGIADRH